MKNHTLPVQTFTEIYPAWFLQCQDLPCSGEGLIAPFQLNKEFAENNYLLTRNRLIGFDLSNGEVARGKSPDQFF
jgi:hypothetical protein